MTTFDTAMTQVMREEIVDVIGFSRRVDEWIAMTEQELQSIKQRLNVETPPLRGKSAS